MSFLKIFGKKKSNNKSTKRKERIFSWKKIFLFKKLNLEFYENLEETMILSDFGGKNVVKILFQLKTQIEEEKIIDPEQAQIKLKQILKNFFKPNGLIFTTNKMPVLCFIGINGVGKTTTLAKVANYFKNNYHIVIGAADTYRAAAVLQLEEWGKRLQLPVISKGENTDAASVAFDTIESALAKNKSIKKKNPNSKTMVLIDTAGRMQNKNYLIDQLNKLIRVCDRFSNNIERKNILVIDATLGQIGYEQVRIFLNKVGVDGIILTKIDTHSKGGVVVSISESFNLPIFFITFGEGIDQIKQFDVNDYLKSII